MKELVTRLMLHGNNPQSILPTAIFGTASSVSQVLNTQAPPVRIGMWPILSPTNPQAAMGIGCILGYLLDQYQNIRVYPLLSQVDGLPETYEWKIDKSQFSVDDWQLDDLDDNVGLWGELDYSDGHWRLEVVVENDLEMVSEEGDLETFHFEADNPANLIDLLPQAASAIATLLDADERQLVAPIYKIDSLSENDLRIFLEQVFKVELNLFLSLWGRAWSEAEIVSQLDTLTTNAKMLGSFGVWGTAQCVAHIMKFTNLDFPSIVQQVASALSNDPVAIVILSRSLFDKPEMSGPAIEMLQALVDEERADADAYLALSDMYRSSGRIDEMIDCFHDAIESENTNIALLERYADTMLMLDYNNYDVDTFIMLDHPDDYPEDILIWEAIETYEAILEQDPENAEMRSRQLLQLVEMEQGGQRLWSGFQRLVETDKTGIQVRSVINAFYSLENIEPAISILRSAMDASPENVDYLINMGAAYVIEDDGPAARTVLERARSLTVQEDVQDDIERLLLLADDPEFEMHLGEITDILSAGNPVDSEDVEFLENILEKVPQFAEAYTLLAQAYIQWDEPSDAIETLLDGHKRLPENPDIIVLLSEQLWKSGEEALALQYLSASLRHNPGYVPLLALTGLYLFEDGQEDHARAYLQRAELVSPQHPALIQVRQRIAQAF